MERETEDPLTGELYFIEPTPTPPGSLTFQAAGWRHILTMHPDGTIEIGSGFTPTEAAKEFLKVLAEFYPNYVRKPAAS